MVRGGGAERLVELELLAGQAARRTGKRERLLVRVEADPQVAEPDRRVGERVRVGVEQREVGRRVLVLLGQLDEPSLEVLVEVVTALIEVLGDALDGVLGLDEVVLDRVEHVLRHCCLLSFCDGNEPVS